MPAEFHRQGLDPYTLEVDSISMITLPDGTMVPLKATRDGFKLNDYLCLRPDKTVPGFVSLPITKFVDGDVLSTMTGRVVAISDP